MSIIKVSIDKIYGILEPVDLELIKERVEVSNRMLSDGSGDGNDFLGWVDLPRADYPPPNWTPLTIARNRWLRWPK